MTSAEFESIMFTVRLVYILAVLPVAMAVFLVHVRVKYTVDRYLIAATPFLAFAVVYAMHHDDVHIGAYRGFESRGLIYAFATIAALCAPRTRTKWAQAGQVAASFLAANCWILSSSWVA